MSQTTATGFAIVREAAKYITPENICQETGNNTSECIDAVKASYGINPGTEAYCAIFAWAVVNNAMTYLGLPNQLPKTASAIDMRNRSAGHLKMDTNPNIGSVFYRKTTAGGSGHIGIVVQTDNDIFHTIEGNTSFWVNGKKYEGIWAKNYPYSDIKARSFAFMHTEQANGDNDWSDFQDLMIADKSHSGVSQPNSTFLQAGIFGGASTGLKYLIAASLIGTGIYYAWKKKFIKL